MLFLNKSSNYFNFFNFSNHMVSLLPINNPGWVFLRSQSYTACGWTGQHIAAHSFFFKLFFDTILKKFIYLFLERGEEREREGEKHQCAVASCVPPPPPLGTWPATQACALTGNQTGDPLVRRLALNQLSHTSQSAAHSFLRVLL